MQLFKSKKIQNLQNEVKALQQYVEQNIRQTTINQAVQFINNTTAYYPEWGVIDYIQQFKSNDNIYSVFNKVAETTALIPFYASYVKDELKARRLKELTRREFYSTKGIYDITAIQKKALEDSPETDPLARLLAQPNKYQSTTEFFTISFLSYLAKEVFIYKLKLQDGANKGIVKELHILPSQNIVINAANTFPHRVVSYDFIVNGEKVLAGIPPEDIIHIKRINPFSAYGTIESLRGLSILDIAKKLVCRMNDSDDTITAQVQNGGLPGVIYDKSIPLEERGQVELDRQRKVFFDFVNDSSNKGAPYWAAGELGYIATGLKLADMEMGELTKRDFKRLCNLIKISDFLFNNDAKYDNAEQYIKQMYTNACLPLAYLFRDKFNVELVNDFSDKKRRQVYVDITAITEIQDDIQKWATAISSLPAAPSVNEQRAVLNYEALGDPEDENNLYNKPLIKTGYNFIEDISQTDITINDLPNV